MSNRARFRLRSDDDDMAERAQGGSQRVDARREMTIVVRNKDSRHMELTIIPAGTICGDTGPRAGGTARRDSREQRGAPRFSAPQGAQTMWCKASDSQRGALRSAPPL